MDQADNFKKTNQELIQTQLEERKREIEEQNKIEEYARKRDALDQLRRDKEE